MDRILAAKRTACSSCSLRGQHMLSPQSAEPAYCMIWYKYIWRHVSVGIHLSMYTWETLRMWWTVWSGETKRVLEVLESLRVIVCVLSAKTTACSFSTLRRQHMLCLHSAVSAYCMMWCMWRYVTVTVGWADVLLRQDMSCFWAVCPAVLLLVQIVLLFFSFRQKMCTRGNLAEIVDWWLYETSSNRVLGFLLVQRLPKGSAREHILISVLWQFPGAYRSPSGKYSTRITTRLVAAA